jgi:hypothetical protein
MDDRSKLPSFKCVRWILSGETSAANDCANAVNAEVIRDSGPRKGGLRLEIIEGVRRRICGDL